MLYQVDSWLYSLQMLHILINHPVNLQMLYIKYLFRNQVQL